MTLTAGARFTVVIAGDDYTFAVLSNPLYTPLESRVSSALIAIGGANSVQIESMDVKTSQTATQFLIGQSSYIATVQCRTSVAFGSAEDAASWIRSAFQRATTLMPASMSVTVISGTSTGAPTPTAPTTVLGTLEATTQGIADLLLSASQGSKLLLWAIVGGAIVLVGLVVVKPQAAKASAKLFL